MKNIIALLGFIAGCSPAFSQTDPISNITGIVTNEKEELLIGASVFWKDTKQGTVTDTAGRFSLPARNEETTLVVNYIGYTSRSAGAARRRQDLGGNKGRGAVKRSDRAGQGFRYAHFDAWRPQCGIHYQQRTPQSTLLQSVRKLPDQWCD
ncbi:MAG: carboxypeptidase-like regulatory domain-containing protein [Lewinellaceae bacterium]|nr:carboxypeptidase-like regulatory domain-containing protein [Lewinellaceae bacterium]